MALHFSTEEFAERRRRAIAAMAEARLDGLLMFRQESMYYLTGYDTFGYVYFQCVYLGADGTLFKLLPRSFDRRFGVRLGNGHGLDVVQVAVVALHYDRVHRRGASTDLWIVAHGAPDQRVGTGPYGEGVGE